MPIYTKTGDRGMTSLFGGKRIAKDDIHVEAYGSADELSSVIGLVIVNLKGKSDKKLLISVQKDLYQIMAYLAGAKVDIAFLGRAVKQFEQYIDKTTSKLSKLKRFILPGGTKLGALLHVSRTACRKTERRVVFLFKKYKIEHSGIILIYLNRLSDLFFTMARKYSKGKEVIT